MNAIESPPNMFSMVRHGLRCKIKSKSPEMQPKLRSISNWAMRWEKKCTMSVQRKHKQGAVNEKKT